MSTEGQGSQSQSQSHQEQLMSALFAQLVMQQANMAMMLLGKVPNPETGKPVKDLDAARLFIDELEMLEVKTKGNLTKDESTLLKQSLMSLRLAYVQEIESPKEPATPSASKAPVAPAESGPGGSPEKSASASASGSAEAPSARTEDESRKKFSKKY